MAMGKKALVLVDGGHVGRNGLGSSLLGEGYAVETTLDSLQAIRKVKEAHYDVAVIDLDLPPLHGVAMTAWDLGRIFRAYNPAISIVYLAGAPEPERSCSWIREQLDIEQLDIQRKGECVR